MVASNDFRHHRHSIRMPGYDYSQPGVYFITVCSQERNPLFGEIVDGQMQLNKYGQVAQGYWREIPVHFPNVTLDEFVVMPNHIQGIIVITDVVGVGAQHAAPLPDAPLPTNLPVHLPAPRSIPAIVRSYKSTVTKRIHEMCGMTGTPVWQRNYWEHIVRNDDALERIRYYIRTNPQKWDGDEKIDGEDYWV